MTGVHGDLMAFGLNANGSINDKSFCSTCIARVSAHHARTLLGRIHAKLTYAQVWMNERNVQFSVFFRHVALLWMKRDASSDDGIKTQMLVLLLLAFRSVTGFETKWKRDFQQHPDAYNAFFNIQLYFTPLQWVCFNLMWIVCISYSAYYQAKLILFSTVDVLVITIDGRVLVVSIATAHFITQCILKTRHAHVFDRVNWGAQIKHRISFWKSVMNVSFPAKELKSFRLACSCYEETICKQLALFWLMSSISSTHD